MFSLESNNMWLVNSQHAAEGGLEGLPTTPHLAVIGMYLSFIELWLKTWLVQCILLFYDVT